MPFRATAPPRPARGLTRRPITNGFSWVFIKASYLETILCLAQRQRAVSVDPETDHWPFWCWSKTVRQYP
ncbi:MAG: hypothetical protein LAT61_06225 [Alcanivorax sp.]|nr:hypothetical protein [Alcanivorax sp.]